MLDLHIHTDASSDGQHSPREIFEMARGKGLRAIAFADHNSIDPVAEGLEVYTPYHSPEEQEGFRNFDAAHELLAAAGSDFHGKAIKPDVDLAQGGENHYDLLLKLKKWRKDKR